MTRSTIGHFPTKPNTPTEMADMHKFRCLMAQGLSIRSWEPRYGCCGVRSRRIAERGQPRVLFIDVECSSLYCAKAKHLPHKQGKVRAKRLLLAQITEVRALASTHQHPRELDRWMYVASGHLDEVHALEIGFSSKRARDQMVALLAALVQDAKKLAHKQGKAATSKSKAAVVARAGGASAAASAE